MAEPIELADVPLPRPRPLDPAFAVLDSLGPAKAELKAGMTLDQLPGSTEWRVSNRDLLSVGANASPGMAQRAQMGAATRISDAVPRRPEQIVAVPVPVAVPDPQAEMLARAEQKNKANMLDWAALKEWLNKAGTGDELESLFTKLRRQTDELGEGDAEGDSTSKKTISPGGLLKYHLGIESPGKAGEK